MNFDLTHPEILTIEQLQKFVGSESTNDRYELIELFYKYIAPLPQRKFRANRLGIILTDNQRQFRGEKRRLSSDKEYIEKKPKVNLPANGLNAQSQSEKHDADRGIYTITMQNSGKKNTAPIKLKRPTSTTVTDIDQDANKRLKLDPANT